MLVDVRPAQRLRGTKPLDLPSCLSPIMDALSADGDLDLSRLRLVCDWIQYRHNFREPVEIRPILAPSPQYSPAAHSPSAHSPAPRNAVHNGHSQAPDQVGGLELAVDLRRCPDPALGDRVRDILRGLADPRSLGRIHLEDWTPARSGLIWDFNALYWRDLGVWEQATGRQYEQALPGGQSDAHNTAAARELIGELFTVWDSLAARNALPDELYVVELGVGNGLQAKAWLDEFAAMDAHRGTEYYRRLQYLMCDYSEHVLAMARSTVAAHAGHVSSFALDATKPTTALGFLRYKVFLVYVSNVYDNLPTEEVARIGGQIYRTEARAYLPADEAARIGAMIGVAPAALRTLVHKLLRLGPALVAEVLPEAFGTLDAAAAFWREVWSALRLAERYVPLYGLDLYEVAPGVSGEHLRPLLEDEGDIRMQVSNGAVASFVDTLPILHPHGRLQCHDLFVTDVHQYRNGFRGPGKYDGSVVNWVNGPLLAHIGRRKGFDVTYTPFTHRAKTNIVTLTAQVRD